DSVPVYGIGNWPFDLNKGPESDASVAVGVADNVAVSLAFGIHVSARLDARRYELHRISRASYSLHGDDSRHRFAGGYTDRPSSRSLNVAFDGADSPCPERAEVSEEAGVSRL